MSPISSPAGVASSKAKATPSAPVRNAGITKKKATAPTILRQAPRKAPSSSTRLSLSAGLDSARHGTLKAAPAARPRPSPASQKAAGPPPVQEDFRPGCLVRQIYVPTSDPAGIRMVNRPFFHNPDLEKPNGTLAAPVVPPKRNTGQWQARLHSAEEERKISQAVNRRDNAVRRRVEKLREGGAKVMAGVGKREGGKAVEREREARVKKPVNKKLAAILGGKRVGGRKAGGGMRLRV